MTNLILETLIATCLSCHGAQDVARPYDGIPHINSQDSVYLEKQLKAFRSGERKNPAMEVIAGRLTDDQIRYLSEYFGQKSPYWVPGVPLR